MKISVKISRIVTCVLTSLYTLLMCYHVAQNVRYACYRITPAGEEYVMGFDSITSVAWFYIASGVALLALCVVTVIFLFRKGWLSALIATLSVTTSAICGMCLNTTLAEFTLWREFMRWLSVEDALAASLSVKPMAAYLCICAAVVYVVLCLVAYRKKN